MANHLGELADSYYAAGVACTDLIVNPKSWVNRRVETIELLSREETRRRVSVDFTLPADRRDALTIEDGLVAPISVLTKEARRNFDLRNESGAAVPVLGKHQNGELAHIALMSAALDALPADLTPEVFEMLSADLRRVVFDAPEEAENALAFFIAGAEDGDRWRAAIWQDGNCRSLLQTLWVNYVLFAVLDPETPARRVLKYSYGDELDLHPEDQPLRARLGALLRYGLWWPDRRQFFIPCPAAWRAASFHVEIAIPDELRIEVGFLYDREHDTPLSDADINVNRAALYAPDDINEESWTYAYAEVAPERAGRTSLSAAIALVVAALLWVGVASGLDAQNPGAAISLLLGGAAIYSGLVAAQGQHLIWRRVFAASRRWLGVLALSGLAASASLAMEVPCEEPVAVWAVCAGVCSAAAARLIWSAVRAPA